MLHKPLTPIDDDTEEAPWMVMGTPQWNAAAALCSALHGELQSRQPAPFVAAMLPIRYYPIPGGDIEQLAPDIVVAWVPIRDRSSYDVEREGVSPAFLSGTAPCRAGPRSSCPAAPLDHDRTCGHSRQYFVRLLESGVIPFHKVGTHRRVNLQDVLAYRRRRSEMRREALANLTRMSQEMGDY